LGVDGRPILAVPEVVMTDVPAELAELRARVSAVESRLDTEASLRAMVDMDLSGISTRLGAQHRLLLALAQTQSDHGRMLREHSGVLAEHSGVLAEHSRVLAEHSSVLADHTQRLARIEDRTQRIEDRTQRIEDRTQAIEDRTERVEAGVQAILGLLGGKGHDGAPA
jgi:chromosome segregation ATPase